MIYCCPFTGLVSVRISCDHIRTTAMIRGLMMEVCDHRMGLLVELVWTHQWFSLFSYSPAFLCWLSQEIRHRNLL